MTTFVAVIELLELATDHWARRFIGPANGDRLLTMELPIVAMIGVPALLVSVNFPCVHIVPAPLDVYWIIEISTSQYSLASDAGTEIAAVTPSVAPFP